MNNRNSLSRLRPRTFATAFLVPILVAFAPQTPPALVAPVKAMAGGTPDPVTQPNSGVFVVEFEGFENGLALRGHEYPQLFSLRSRGSNAGLAVFDSSTNGPNDDGSDSDLIVDTGNLLILQNDLAQGYALEGIYKNPTPDPNGGAVTIGFTSLMHPVSINLVALNSPSGYLNVSLTDSEQRLRTYFVPGGFTGGFGTQSPASFMQLDLTTLDPQVGANATATATEDAGFDADSVLQIRMVTNESVAVDRLEFQTGSFEDCDYPQPAFQVPGASNTATADLDGDGTLDMATTAGAFSGPTFVDEVQIFLNPGSGQFSEPVGYPSGTDPDDIALGDLTGDGYPEVVIANRKLPIFNPLDGGISILANRGDGTFDPRTEVSLPGEMQSVALRDFDDDGDLDVCIGNYDSFFGSATNPTRILTLLNGGTGVFTTLHTSIMADGQVGPVVSADLDGDGTPEVVRTNNSQQTIKLFFNKGNGAFDPAVTFTGFGGLGACQLADVDLDGDVEVLFASSAIWINDNFGDGTFNVAVPHGAIRGAQSLGMTDWDSDGYIDAVVGKKTGLALFRNNQQGGFIPSRRYATLDEPTGFSFADLDDDSNIDFLVLDADGNDRSVQTWLNRGDGQFRTRIEYPGFQATSDILNSDVDEDANLDVIVADAGDDQIAIYAGNGDGTLEPPTLYPVEESPIALISADLNGDGAADLSVACSHGDAVSVLLNQGGGTFAPQVAYATTLTPSPNVDNPSGMTAGDWNNDGFIDLAVGTDFGSSGNPHVLTMTNNGDGTFADAVRLDLLSFVKSITSADFDQDGNQDLAVVVGIKGFLPSRLRVSIQLGDGMGNFVTDDEVIGSNDVDQLRVADWDGDGLPDLVASQRLILSQGPTFAVILNQGNADFELGDEFSLETSSTFEVSDLDDDGNHEIMLTNFANRTTLSLYEQQPGPVLSPPNRFATGGTIHAISVGDLNNDGRPDLISGGSGIKHLVILLMECD